MNIPKVYKNFSGKFSACPGADCQVSCCRKATKEGIEIFPDEVIYLCKNFDHHIPVRLEANEKSSTGFFMYDCTKNLQCLLGKHKPILCRTYPLKLYKIGAGKYKLMEQTNCPKATNLEDDFYEQASKLLLHARKPKNFRWWKKWRARRWLLKKQKIYTINHTINY